MIILFDMDGTLLNWNERFDHLFEMYYPKVWDLYHSTVGGTGKNKLFAITDTGDSDLNAELDQRSSAFYGVSFKHIIYQLMDSQLLYQDLRPLPGAVEYVKSLMDRGHTTLFVTSPTYTNANCCHLKYQWIVDHFGRAMGNKLILTKDKTVVHGDVLIDDKPDITGCLDIDQRSWRQVLVDMPYNVGADLPRLYGWSDVQLADKLILGV